MGIITNSMSGAGDKGQGYIDVTNEVPADLTKLNSNQFSNFLKSCYEKGYKEITFSFGESNVTYTVYCVSSRYQINEGKTAEWNLMVIKNTSGIKTSYFGSFDPNNTNTNDRIGILNTKQYHLEVSDSYPTGICRCLQNLRNTDNSQVFTKTYALDMYYETVNCPTAITSALTELPSISNCNFCRKIWLKCTSNQTINGKTLLSEGTDLYLNETKSSYSHYAQTFTGGILRDADENEYDVQIRTPYSGTVTYTLNIIQRSIKLADNSTSGTFTDYEISTLQNGTKQIELNNEIYKLSNTGADSITFTSLAGKKHINIVISTKAWTLVEESPNPTCYDTNETIDFTAIMAEYIADTTKSGKLRPFTSSDTLLSSEAIKAIIDGNYKMFSFNAKIGENEMKAYMPISYYSEVNSSNFYTFKGQVTFLNNGWNTIDVQMQFIAGTYTNNPGFGFFKYTAETAISA